MSSFPNNPTPIIFNRRGETAQICFSFFVFHKLVIPIKPHLQAGFSCFWTSIKIILPFTDIRKIPRSVYGSFVSGKADDY